MKNIHSKQKVETANSLIKIDKRNVRRRENRFYFDRRFGLVVSVAASLSGRSHRGLPECRTASGR